MSKPSSICGTSLDLAQELLGQNFWGPGDWLKFLGVEVPRFAFDTVGVFPWSDAILTGQCPFNSDKQVKDTHFAFLGLEKVVDTPLTISTFEALFPATGQPRFMFYDDSWYHNEAFATKTSLQFRWYLMLKEFVPGSENKTWNEQQPLVPVEYEVPEAVADVAKNLLCCKKVGNPISSKGYGRTSSLDLVSGGHVLVAPCESCGVIINVYADDGRYGGCGLSVSRKLGM